MQLFLCIVFTVVILAAAIATVWVDGLWKLIPSLIGVGVIALYTLVLFHSWIFVIFGAVIAIAFFLLNRSTKLVWQIIFGVLLLGILVGGTILMNATSKLGGTTLTHNTSKPELATPSAACQPAENLNLTTGGMVENNLDDGDAVMGTVLMVTRDNPTKDPVLFVIMPGASVDVEYRGQMYFTSDRFDGTLAEAACLAQKLHSNVNDLVVVGAKSETLPSGWKTEDKVNGWWKASAWLYSETPIQPEGLTASEGIFVSATQKERTLKTNNNEVIYGQFWKVAGSVVHVQVRQNDEQKIPKGYQGTYWIWTGDFKIGETDLQKRMLQATFHEVVDRDNVTSVTLLSCGTLPPELDKSLYTLYTGKSKFGDVTWQSSLDGWACQSTTK